MDHRHHPPRNFLGVWIEADLWLDPNLCPTEMKVFAEVRSLSNPECTASLTHIARMCGITKGRASQIITRLIEDGYIEVVEDKPGVGRVLKALPHVSGTRTPSPQPPATPEQPQPTGFGPGDVVDLYHELCPDLPRVVVFNSSRRSAALARMRERPTVNGKTLDTGSAAFWRAFFGRVSESDFLMGRGEKSERHKNWSADFDFLMSPKGFTGVIEGKYL